jgi:hypothetical protein
MKTVMLLLASLVFVVFVFMSGVFVTAYMIAEPEPHKFAHLDNPDLWKSEPAKVEVSQQNYDRLPSAPVVVSVPASDIPEPRIVAGQPVPKSTSPSIDTTATGSVDPQSAPAQQAALNGGGMSPTPNVAVDPAHASWCFARYRSYRVEDNTYQPFSGGERRQCQAPGSENQQTASAAPSRSQSKAYDQMIAQEPQDYAQPVSDDASQVVGSEQQAGSHEQWCSARYRSYDASDDSYQPFDGGPRRTCESPFG